jgi:hypothetical protein
MRRILLVKQDVERVGFAETGSRASTEPPSTGSLGPTGFDPARVFSAMRRYLREARQEGVIPVAWHISEPLAKDLALDGARPAKLLDLRVIIHDEWSWGWMMTAKRHSFDFDSGAFFWTPRCDSDGSGEAGKTRSVA